MPEIITQYPDALRYVLKSAGAQCGTGAEQKILTSCPKEKFCTLPRGEICIYTIKDLPHTTQFDVIDFAEVTRNVPSMLGGANLILITIIFWLGFYLGMKLMSKRDTQEKK